MIMYDHENDDDYRFILRWFIDLGDVVHGASSTEQDDDKNHTSHECEDHGI